MNDEAAKILKNNRDLWRVWVTTGIIAACYSFILSQKLVLFLTQHNSKVGETKYSKILQHTFSMLLNTSLMAKVIIPGSCSEPVMVYVFPEAV